MNLPPYNLFPTLSTDKITLREIQVADIPGIVEISFYDAIKADNEKEAFEMQVKINQNYIEGNSIHWGIASRTTNKIMGTCGYYRGFETGTGELGCVLLPPFQGQGIMTEALKLAIDFGLNKMNLNRIISITNSQNQKAVNLLGRLHFQKIAELPDGDVEFEFKF